MKARTNAKNDEVLEIASEAFLELGYERTSMSEIAARLGGAKATLYGYFPPKEALFLSIMQKSGERYILPALSRLAACTDQDVRSALRHFGEQFLEIACASEQVITYRIIISQATHPDICRAFFEAGPKHVREGLTRYLSGAMNRGQLRKAKLQALGLTASYSRPSVSDDNAYAESLFRTCKYRPDYPGAFASLEQARAWALSFERWYNHEHKHRNLKFVSPAQRHCGADRSIFARRIAVYEQARKKHPVRWRAATRDWSLPKVIWLNHPADDQQLRKAA